MNREEENRIIYTLIQKQIFLLYPNLNYEMDDKNLSFIIKNQCGSSFLKSIIIAVDAMELTLFIKPYYHCHFEFYNSLNNGDDKYIPIINEMLNYVNDIIIGTVVLRIKSKKGKILSTKLCYKDDENGKQSTMFLPLNLFSIFLIEKTEIEEYSWRSS